MSVNATGFAGKTSRVAAIRSEPSLMIQLARQTVQQSWQVHDLDPSLASQAIENTGSTVKTIITAEEPGKVPLSARSFANISLMAPFTAPVEASDPTKVRITCVCFGGSSGINVDLSVDGRDNNDDYVAGFRCRTMYFATVACDT